MRVYEGFLDTVLKHSTVRNICVLAARLNHISSSLRRIYCIYIPKAAPLSARCAAADYECVVEPLGFAGVFEQENSQPNSRFLRYLIVFYIM